MKKQDYLDIRNQLATQRKTSPLVYFYATDFALIALIFLTLSTKIFFLGAPILAIIMFRHFALMHDASHGAISRNRSFNNFVGLVSGCVSFLPFQAWRESHLEHHLWSGNLEKDPVMAIRVAFPKAPAKLQNALSFAWRHWIPALATLQYSLFWLLSFKTVFTKNASLLKKAELATPLMFWTTLIGLSPEGSLLKLFLPGFGLYLLLTELVNLPHHLQLPTLAGDARLPFWEQYKTARSCLYPDWMGRLITLNFNLHAEHHMFPDAPWYTLPAIQKAVGPHIAHEHYVDHLFEWSIENRKNHLLEVTREDSRKENAA